MHAFTRRLFARLRLLALLVLLAALAVRCWDINARSLWFDEACEYWVATAPVGELPSAVREAIVDPPLYSFVLHCWMELGQGEIHLRSLSVAFSLIGIAGLMVLGRRIGGWPAALAAGSLMAVLPTDVRYAQEVGQYSLMQGALAWNLVALHRMMTACDRRAYALWIGTALCASYTHYGAVFAVMIPFACLVIERVVRKERGERGLVPLAIYAVGVLPLLLFFLPEQLSRVLHPGASNVQASVLASGIGAIWSWFTQVVAFQFTGWPYTRVPAWIPIVCVTALLVLAARAHRRLFVALAVTWVVYTAAAFAHVYPYGFRWGTMMTPLLVGSTAAGFAAGMRGRSTKIAAWLCLACLALGAIASLPNRTLRARLYPGAKWVWPETEDVRPVVAYWREHRVESQPTYVYYGAAPAFAYYSRARAGGDAGLPPTWYLACWHDGTADFCRTGNVYYGRWLRPLTEPQRLLSVRETLGSRPSELWLVFQHVSHPEDRQILSGILGAGYSVERAYQATGASVFLLKAN